ncbi:MAG: hypothetical protein IJS13_09215 [Paludibacteraceae bacterium]|nr:hypothetical protein [Paludibacteraceae bacterium]
MKQQYKSPIAKTFKLQSSQVLCSSPDGVPFVGLGSGELDPNAIGD